MSWSIAGLATSLAVAALAFTRSRGPGGFYDAHVYGMTPRVHRRYGFTALAFALAFLLTMMIAALGTMIFWLFASSVLLDLFYLTSYLRGASEDDD